MVLETGGKGRERDKHKMWGAECQSHWKQLLILSVLCQPHEFRPQGWHGPGAMEEADISLPGGWHWTAKHPSVLSPACGGCLPDQQQRSFAARLYLACRWLSFSARGMMIILPLGWFIILGFFSCWFFELLNWYLDSLILRSIDVMGHCLYVSTLSTELLVVLPKLIMFLMGDLICSQSWQTILLACKYILDVLSCILLIS